MLSKNKRPYNPDELTPRKRIRANIQNMFATNQLSGPRSQELINDIDRLDTTAVSQLARPQVGQNATRDLRRTFMKYNQWPALYFAAIRVKSLKTQGEVYQRCAFMLPHEIVEVLGRLGDHQVMMDRSGLEPSTRRHVERCDRDAGYNFLALGLWCDGVPVNYDRTESVETFSLNLPGQSGEYSTLRIPLTAFSRKQLSEHTWHDVMQVLSWSFTQLVVGLWPTQRHDGAQFKREDKRRAKHAGKQLGMRAVLSEMRGDWKMFSELLHLPNWLENQGICWRCTCTPQEATRTNLHEHYAHLDTCPGQSP